MQSIVRVVPAASVSGFVPSTTYSVVSPFSLIVRTKGIVCRSASVVMYSMRTFGSACQWMARPDAVFCPGPPTCSVSVVAVSVFVSSSAYSRMVRVRSPCPSVGEWQVPQVSSAGRSTACDAGMGRGKLPLMTCTS